MHILVIPSWYPENTRDISGSFFREQAIALQKKGHKVGVIYPQLRSLRDWKNLLKKLGKIKTIDEGVVTYRYVSLNITPRFNKLILRHWLLLGKLLYEEYTKEHGKPDIIHVHSIYNAVFVAYFFYKKYRVPYLITEHSSAFARGLYSKEILTKALKPVQIAKQRIAVSFQFARLLERLFPLTKWEYVPNIVSQFFLDYVPETNIPQKGYTFLNICLLNENKRVDILIKAFALMYKEYKNIYLEIGGDGPARKRLEQLVSDLGISDRVSFLGLIPRDQVPFIMSNANAFVLSSEYETFGVVLIEALALGKPIVATRCGGPESIVTEEVGCLVEEGSEEELYKGMKKVYSSNFNTKKIKQYCIDNFSENVVIAKLERIYRNIIEVQS